MEEIYQFYQDSITAFTKKLDNLKKKIHLIGTIRLLMVCAICVGLWFVRNESWTIILLMVSGFFIPFLGFILLHNKLFKQKLYTETILQLDKDELNGLDYNFSAFDGAPELTDPTHPFGLDLDLFGEKSLFQSINRTVTHGGKSVLSGWFRNPSTQKGTILRRQAAVRELAENTQLRQHFFATGSMYKGDKNDDKLLEALTAEAILFEENIVWKILAWLFPIAWITSITLYSFDLIGIPFLSTLFTLSFIVSYSQTKKINKVHQSVSKMNSILDVYGKLMLCIERYPFQCEALMDLGKNLSNPQSQASMAIKRLSKHTGNLDQRYNLLAGFILNILLLWDIRQACNIERWRKQHKEDIRKWFDTLYEFDAYSSLGGFAFNHPGYIYPEIADEYFRMEGKDLGHPLLHRDLCVKNDISIKKRPWFLIITGANMAGKSTYLRTVGVNYLLALTGAPVCASELSVYPAQLITSLRTADSLVNHESYFFAELKRLKMIIDRLAEGKELFIILDEILKGTNSVDKQKGSLALMKQLISYKACGIIATHDLVLGTLEDEFPDQLKNYRFEADIKENELSFSYELREGIAQNMNACFLMKQMGITV